MTKISSKTETQKHHLDGDEEFSRLEKLTMPIFKELDDKEWDLVAGLYQIDESPHLQRGRPPADPRAMVNAVLWVLSTGKSWLTLPSQYPSPPTCRRRFELWQADGTWQEMTRRLECTGRIIATRKSRNAKQHSTNFSENSVRATFWSALLR